METEEGEDKELSISCDFRGHVVNDAYEGRVVVVRPLYFMPCIEGRCPLVFNH